jgi:hypothetical protein
VHSYVFAAELKVVAPVLLLLLLLLLLLQGLTMFKNMPCQMFGRVQSKLFPM